jgi:hypothetical protein
VTPAVARSLAALFLRGESVAALAEQWGFAVEQVEQAVREWTVIR